MIARTADTKIRRWGGAVSGVATECSAIGSAAHCPRTDQAIATARPACATIAFSVALGRIAFAVFFSHGW